MTPREIRNTLEDFGLTQRALAQRIGVSAMMVSHVIRQQRISDRVMRAVAEAIDKDHRLVFPDYYLSPPKRKTSKVAPL